MFLTSQKYVIPNERDGTNHYDFQKLKPEINVQGIR